MKILQSILSTILIFAQVNAFAGKLQNEDFKTLSQITTAGGTVSQLLNTNKIYDPITGGQLSTAFSGSMVGAFLTTSSLTLNSVLLGNGSSAPQTVAPGTNGNILKSDGTTWVSASNPAAPVSSQEVSNLGISATVSANALTIAVKQSDGSSDCSSVNPCKIGFRSSTSTSGAVNQRSITSALSIVVPSGTTIGTTSSSNEYLYVYAIDNAGTIEEAVATGGLADPVSGAEGSNVNTTAISGGTLRNTFYSTTARTGVPIRLIARVKITETTPGTWVSPPTEVSLIPFNHSVVSMVRLDTSNGYGSTNTKIKRFTNVVKNVGPAITYTDSSTLGSVFTINEDGVYAISYTDNGSAGMALGLSLNSSQLTTVINSITVTDRMAMADTSAANATATVAWTGFLKNTDVVRPHTDGTTVGLAARCHFTIAKVSP